MAGSPNYKLFKDKEYVGSAKYLGDAAMFVAALGEGAVVKWGHNKVIWTEGRETIDAAESYDGAAEIMEFRIEEYKKATVLKFQK